MQPQSKRHYELPKMVSTAKASSTWTKSVCIWSTSQNRATRSLLFLPTAPRLLHIQVLIPETRLLPQDGKIVTPYGRAKVVGWLNGDFDVDLGACLLNCIM